MYKLSAKVPRAEESLGGATPKAAGRAFASGSLQAGRCLWFPPIATVAGHILSLTEVTFLASK